MSDQPRIISVDLTHLVHAALAAEDRQADAEERSDRLSRERPTRT
jgi:hypothetical protein